jgi:hypothetical protein
MIGYFKLYNLIVINSQHLLTNRNKLFSFHSKTWWYLHYNPIRITTRECNFQWTRYKRLLDHQQCCLCNTGTKDRSNRRQSSWSRTSLRMHLISTRKRRGSCRDSKKTLMGIFKSTKTNTSILLWQSYKRLNALSWAQVLEIYPILRSMRN